ncbi:hypothetical protein E6O75_ATG00537 [Venturia nashicola]|uniref:Uncharacterized protein n=1 Tax=Venturia nashicola TaxID=86259 RepID=A0A4Z1PWG8_9PEZI|nr:hypothetical protein E6O75_ATG00537 [Venturia nashicola]
MGIATEDRSWYLLFRNQTCYHSTKTIGKHGTTEFLASLVSKNALKAREVVPNEVSVPHTSADRLLKITTWTDLGFTGDGEE